MTTSQDAGVHCPTEGDRLQSKELDRGTLRAILCHAGLTVEEFTDLLG